VARKSRVNVIEAAPAAAELYNTAVYARLSAEDTDCDSLENQISLIESYINGKPQLKIAERYTDNGLTGRTFERDGYQRMMDDIKARKINCVVVKDFSRFARNYIEACEYLEKIFPFMGVRFISVNDNFDSDRDDPTDVIIMLKNLINHEYAKDLSCKILSVLSTKRKNGEYMGSQAPYGYRKSAEDKHKLEIDGETAPVVSDIFQWRVEGTSYTKIARRLNEMGIPCPSQRMRDKGKLINADYLVNSMWQTATIKLMLSNHAYIGNLVQGKRRQVIRDGKVTEVFAPEAEWDIVENTHDPIISMETWQTVQDMKEQCRNAHNGKIGLEAAGEKDNVFRGLIRCGDCGTKMSRIKSVIPSGKATYRYTCYVHHQNLSLSCKNKGVRELDITNAVHKIISEEIKRTVDIKAIIEDLGRDSEKEKAELSKQIAAKNKRISQFRVLRMSLVESLAVKRISEDDFIYAKAKHEAEEAQLRQEIETLEARINDESLTVKNKWITSFQRFMDEKIITREMAVTLIQKIVAHDNEHIDIYLNFRGDYEKLNEYIGEVEAI
jgi:DNA invertase Pin-like site-specific DNA recombinase